MALPISARRLRDLDFTEWRRSVEKMLASLDDRIARVGGRPADLVYPAGTPALIGTAPPAGTPMLVKVGTAVVTVFGATGDVNWNYYGGAFPHGITSVVTSPGDDTANYNVVRMVPSGSNLATFYGRAITNAGYVTGGLTIRVNYVAYGW